MTKKLSELFDLPETPSASKANEDFMDQLEAQVVIDDASDALSKIEAALPQVRGLEASDTEMDELAQKATESFENLMDLGMQVDSRFASEIFNSASSMLGHAITAKTAKINKKLKILDLQLKKAQMDHKIASTKGPEEIENTPIGEGSSLVDRNELLRQILANSKKD